MSTWIQERGARSLARVPFLGIRAKLMGVAVGLVLLLGGTLTLEVRGAFSRTLNRELDARGLALGHDVAVRATDLVLTNDLYRLNELVWQMCTAQENMRYLLILDMHGGVLAHTFPQGVPPGLLHLRAGRPMPPVQVVDTDEGPMHDLVIPILDGRAGTIRLGLTEAGVRRTLTALVWRLLLVTALVSLAGIAAAMALTNHITHPLRALAAASGAIERGDFRQRLQVRSRDEVGQLSAAFNAMADSLECGRLENARLVAELRREGVMRIRLLDEIMRAQEDERGRVARELHDETGQCLTSLTLSLRALEELVTQCQPCEKSGEVCGRAADARSVATQALDEVRRLSRDLRPAVLDDLGLAPALDRCVKEFSRRCDIPVDYHSMGLGDVRLAPHVETALYRIVQEALTNVARHARAQTVNIALERHGDRVQVVVEDDGQGFDVAAAEEPDGGGRLGLFSMRERAALVGGTLRIESVPGYGTTVFAQVPLTDGLRRDDNGKDAAAGGG